jgi:hypothetical protein
MKTENAVLKIEPLIYRIEISTQKFENGGEDFRESKTLSQYVRV